MNKLNRKYNGKKPHRAKRIENEAKWKREKRTRKKIAFNNTQFVWRCDDVASMVHKNELNALQHSFNAFIVPSLSHLSVSFSEQVSLYHLTWNYLEININAVIRLKPPYVIFANVSPADDHVILCNSPHSLYCFSVK